MDNNKLPSGIYKIYLPDIKRSYKVLFINNNYYILPKILFTLNFLVKYIPKYFLSTVTYNIDLALKNKIITMKLVKKI